MRILMIMREVSLIEKCVFPLWCYYVRRLDKNHSKKWWSTPPLCLSLSQHSDDDDNITSKNELHCKQSAQKSRYIYPYKYKVCSSI